MSAYFIDGIQVCDLESSDAYFVDGSQLNEITGVTTFTCTSAVTTGVTTSASSCTFTPPVYSGSAALTIGATECLVSAEFDLPVYSALAEVGLYSKLLQDLLCFSGTPTESDFVQFVSDFNDLIDDDSVLTAHDLKFLDQASNDGVLTYYDRDFWIEMIAKKYLSLTGRTFGSSSPSVIADADPLGLRLDTAGNLRTDVIILDPQGANETTSAADGPVVIARGGNVCTTPGGLTKNAGGSSNLWSTTGEAYRYQFWTRFADINEATGGSNVRFKEGPDGTVQNQEVTVYIRYSSSHAQLREEIVWRKRVAGFHAGRIVVRGYPTDAIPSIRMGNSAVDADGVTLDDVSPATIGDINGGTAKPAMINVGDISTRERLNVWIHHLEFVGNRDLVGTFGLMFCATLIQYNGGGLSSGGIERCNFVDFQFITPGDPNAGTFTTLVDTLHATRSADLKICYGIINRADDWVFKHNYIRAVDIDDWPTSGDVEIDDIGGRSLLIGSLTAENNGDGSVVAYNKFEGLKIHVQILCRAVDNVYIAYNDVEVYDNACIYLQECDSPVVEYNRVHNFGDDTYDDENTGQGIVIQKCTRETIRYNIAYNFEPTTTTCYGIWFKNGDATLQSLNPKIYGNILYRNGLYIDLDSAGTIQNAEIYNNLVAGMTEDHKTGAVDFRDAPILVNLIGWSGGTEGTLNGEISIHDNGIWRFDDSTPEQATIETGPHLGIRKSSGTPATDYFDVADSLTGWEDNLDSLPEWLDTSAPEASNDFRLDPTSPYYSYFPKEVPFQAVPVYNLNPLDDFCALTLGLQGEATATFDPPVYTATCTPTTGNVESASTCEFDPPVYSSTCAVTTGETTVDVDCVFASAVFSGTVAVTLSNVESVSVCTFDEPVYTCSLAVTTGETTVSASCSFSQLEFNCSVAVTLSPVTSVSVCVFSTTGTFVASCAVELSPVECDSVVTFVTPITDPTIYSALFNSFDISI